MVCPGIVDVGFVVLNSLPVHIASYKKNNIDLSAGFT